jgi:hypothetical protein
LAESSHVSSKVRRLRPFKVVVAALVYCVRNAGPLFLIAWFPCLLVSASFLILDWLIFAWPPHMPEWLLFRHFDPPTWLTALVGTPWEAMAWAFVLSAMSNTDSTRGAVTTPIGSLSWLRFELSRTVWFTAVVLTLIGLLEGTLRYALLHLLMAAYKPFEMSDGELAIWAQLSVLVRFAVVAVVAAWLYPLAGGVLRTGTFDIGRFWRIMRRNRLRLSAIFFLLTLTLFGLDIVARPGATWLARSLDNPLSWTLQSALIRYAVDFPFSVLNIVAWAVTVGIVLDALDPQPSLAEADRPAADVS